MMDGEKLDHPVVVGAANIFPDFLCRNPGGVHPSADHRTIMILQTNVTAVISALNNIGPGLSLVGPAGISLSFPAFPNMC